MIQRVAENHSKAGARVVHICKKCDKDFHSFYTLREHKRKEQGAQRRSGAQSVDLAQLMRDVDDKRLIEELEPCKHFLVDSEMNNGRHRPHNSAMDTLDPEFLLESQMLCLTV